MKNQLPIWHFCIVALFAGAVFNTLAAQSTFPASGIALPSGKSIVITYEVDVNANACTPNTLPVANLSNQSNVSGSNFATVQTDDPDIAGASNATLTPFAGIPVGNLVYTDVNRNGVFDAGDTGINGVVMNIYLDVNGNNALDAGDGAPLGTATTATVSMQAGVYNFDVCPGTYIIQVDPSNFAMGGALYNSGQPLVSSPTTGAPDPDFNNNDNDDNGNTVSGFGVASAAFTVSAAINHVDFGFKTPTTVTISDLTLSEGSGGGTTAFNFTVTRSDFDESFSLTVNTADGTAVSPSDYTAISGGTINFFGGGNLSTQVTVLVNRDNTVEAAETFTVNLSGAPAGIYVTDAQAVGTINNDDNATVTLSAPTPQNEGNAGTTAFTFTATLNNPVQGGFTVPYTTNVGSASAGIDYTDNDGTLIFVGTAGEMQTWTVNVNGDVTVELDETFQGALGAIAGAPSGVTTAGSPQTATITNDDAATVSIAADVSQSEAITPMPFTINLSNPVDVSVTVVFGSSSITATGGVDFTSLTGASVIFPAGTTTSQTLNATIVPDAIVENDEVFNVSIGTAFASGRNVTTSLASRNGTIVNDDVTTVVLTGGSAANEGNTGTTSRTFTATLSNAVQGGFTLPFTTNDGTATTAGADYVDNDGSLTFAGTAGESQTISVLVNGDLIVEADETFTVALGAASASSAIQSAAISTAGSPQTGTIQNDEQDWGDAPTAAQSGFAASYPTTLANNGARHSAALGGLRLGATIEGNTDGVPNATATGDTDEDGVTLPSSFNRNLPSNITINASATGKLDAWFDWNRDGDWSDPGEQVFTNQSVVAGNNTLIVNTPAGASLGITFARFRLSSVGGLAVTGAAADGEVEDYQINIQNVSLSVSDVTFTETNSGTTNAVFMMSLNNPAPAGGVTFDIATADNTATTANNDYVAQSLTSQSIPAGMSSYSFTVVVNGDNIVENNETFFVNVTNVVGAGVSDAQGIGTINNDDAATVTLSGGIAQNEGNAGTVAYTFTATLNNPVQGGFTVPYTTGGGTATAGTDYTDNDGTLSFAGTAGETKTWTVNVNGDVTVELDETFDAALGAIAGAPAGVTTAGTPQTATITNDDQAVASFTTTFSANEGNSGTQSYTLTFNLSNPVDVPVEFGFTHSDGTATNADNDYINAGGAFTVPVGASGSINAGAVQVIIGDTKVEANEVFNVILAANNFSGRNVVFAGGGSSITNTITIVNDDAATVTLTGGTAQNEGNAGTTGFIFTATLNNAVQGGFTVPYTTGGGTATAGTDYTDNDGTLNFTGTAGETKTWTVNVNGDLTVELNETFEGALGAITGAPAGVTTAGTPQTSTITNDDAATINISANVSQLENITPQSFSVTLSNPVDVPVTVDFSTTAGTATAGTDYTSITNQTVTFPAGSNTSQTVNVVIVNENIVEADETYTVAVANLQASGRNAALGANASRTGTILNDDAATVTLTGGIAQNEGNAGTVAYTFTATLNNPVQGGFSVPYTTGGGTATAGTDYTDNDGTLSFAGTAGETQTWTVNVNGDVTVELNETFEGALGALIGAPTGVTTAGSPQTATINNDDSAVISIAGNVSQPEATTPQVFTVTLSNPVDVNVTVQFSTSDGTATTGNNDYTGIAGQTVTFNAGTTTAQTVPVSIVNDNIVETNEVYNTAIGTLNNSGRNVTLGITTATGTITNDDNSILTLAGGATVSEGNSGFTNVPVTITSSNPVQGGFTVAFALNDGTATVANNDYVDLDATVSFNGTQNEVVPINAQVAGDLIIENNENFTVTISGVNAPLPGTITIAGSPQTITIVNDELDWGDAPTAAQSGFAGTYPTLLADNGARHAQAPGGLRLGATLDADLGGQPDATASGDGADEDGVTLPTSLVINTTANITVNASGAGVLNAWADFNRDGDWNDAGEKIYSDVAVVSGNNNLSFAVPNASLGNTFLRFRLTTAAGTAVDGLAADGEVEDYIINVVDNQFSINDVSISEGNSGATNLDFEISRTSNATASSVNYAITGGTATSGSDYTPLASGTINFPLGGALSQTLTVAVLGDLVIEDNETVIITLSNPVNGAISDNSGTGTINNDDSGTLTLSGGITQNEGNSLTTAYTFTATLSAAVQGGFSVAYTTNNGTATTADNDYQDNDGNLTFTGTAGETQTFTVLVNGDNKVEFDETFTGALGLISGTTTTQNAAITLAGTPQTSTITNDDAAIVAIAGNVSASEATTPQNFSVTLSNPVDVNVTVLFNTSDGTATTADNDYTGISNQTVTFPAGTTTAQTVPVAITNDNKVEANEVYNVAIGTLNAAGRNVTLGTAAATGTITNNDNATVTLSGNVVHPEGNTGLTDYVFTVTLNNPVQGGFTVNYNTNNSSASFGSDYIDNDGDLTFVGTANEVQTIIVQGIGDFIVENNESFRINLNSINGAPIAGAISFGNAQAFGDLLNDEVDYGDAPDTYSTLLASNGARHNAFPTLFLGNATDGDADGQPTATANGDDTDAEGDDDDGVTLPNPLITNVTANVVVRASASGFLDGWVDYDNNGDFSGANEKVFNSVAVVAGINNLSFLVPNGATPALTFARFRLSATGGLSFNGLATSGEVEDYQVQIVNTQFSISDPLVTEGNTGTSNLAFVISRSNAANDCSVNYTITGGTALSGSDYQVLAAGTASFTANGALMQTINVLVNGDVTVELNETVEMTLSAPVNGTILDGTGIGTITNDDAAVLSVNSPTVTEGGPINTVTLTFNLTLSNPSDANVVVNYATVDGSATIANSDYQSAAGTHTFAPGETSKQVVVTINGDCVIEPNESFILRLSNLQNNGRSITLSGGGATTDGTGTITNDDFPPTFTVTGGGVRCDTDTQGLPVGLSGSQTGVNYQLQLNGNNVGAPVAGTGNPISFGEQLAVGTYTVVATIVATGCTQTMLGSVTVSTITCGASISDPCVCLNNATTLENGQFGEQIKVNAPSSQTWTVTAINGLFTTTSAAPPTAPTPITVGTILANIGGNMFTLDGRHIDALGYTVTVSNGRGTSLSIGNSCAYPNPAITSDLTGPFCLYSDPVTLTGTPGDANFVSATFTVNGVPATTFDPGAGLGQYTIVYRVDGGLPKAAGANDPGCVQTVSQIVNVVATPSALTCNDFVNISLDVDCVTEITPDMILEGTYGCFDDYIVELDKTAPFGNGPWVPAVVGTADLGKTYQARVTHLVSGNKCWGDVKIEDKLAPVLSCQNVDLFCPITNYTPAYITNTLGIAAGTPTVTDCSNYTLTHVDTWVDLACGQTFNGQQNLSAYVERKWTAQDQFGNSSTCLQYIYFRRISLTQIVLPGDAEVDCTNPNTSPANTGAPSVTALGQTWTLWPSVGYCELNVTYTDQPLPVCDGTYKILRTWLIYDWCQPTNPGTNPITHIQVIKVLDQSGPVIACPTNLTVSTDPFNCCATVDLPDAIIEDNCSRVNSIGGMITTFDPQTGAQTAMYQIGGTLSTFPGNNLWDLDTLGRWGFTSCLPLGTHRVVYTATDDCGNAGTCSFQLTVRDLVPPSPTCTQITTVAIGTDDPSDCYTPADGCDGAGVTWVKATAFDQGTTDNCSALRFTVQRMSPYSDCINGLADCERPTATQEQDSIKFYCCEVGTTQTVIVRVYQLDLNGNIVTDQNGDPISNQCMVQVEVQDKIKPVCIPPANVTVNCEAFDPSLWAYGKATIADNCCLDETREYQGQCGLTHTASYTQFDTVCNRGTITRTFRAFDCHGQSSQCTQRVVVTYKQDYYVRFPNDVILTVCDGTGSYGEPTFFGENCELLATSYTDELFTVVPDACFKIERTWKVINWCTYDPNQGCIAVPNPNPNAITNSPQNLPGPIVSPVGTPAPWAPTVVSITPGAPATNYGQAYWNANFANNNLNVNCYTYKQIIKVIDTQAPTAQCPASPVEFCDLTTNNGGLWNEMYYWDNRTEQHDLCEGPSDLTLTATDACSGANINIEYLLFLDLDGNGSMETVINSVNLPGYNRVNYNNAGNPNFSGGTPYAFDERAVPGNQKYGFTIQKVKQGNNLVANVRWNTAQSPTNYVVPELPYGTHKIKWLITDGCGNNKECEYTFVVKDCKKPTVVCLNGLSVNIMQTGMVSLWASDFLQYTEDNCTPTPKLKIGIVRSEASTGSFPVDGNGNPITEVQFNCDDTDIEPELVQLWSIDLAGNADFCETYVLVQDNMGNCGGPKPSVAGYLKTEGQQGLEEAEVDLQGSHPAIPPVSLFQNSDQNGKYEFSNAVPVASNVTITPVEDDNHINGVSTFDLVLISKHILGIEPLTSPYKMIAADANKSGSITTFDIVELRKLILGVYTELPNNTSWRFVDKAYSFPNPSNPFANVFPENKTIAEISTSMLSEDFVSVKVGDLNGNAVANNLMQSEDRSAGTLYLNTEDRDIKAGETFEISLSATQNVQGYQLTLNHAGLEILDVMGIKSENFAVHADAVTLSVDGSQTAATITLKVRAMQSGKLSRMLGVSSRITKAEAYNAASERLDIALRYNNSAVITGLPFELYQNVPNPFISKTSIGFHLPEAATATLKVYDESGRVLLTQKGDFAKGYNQFSLDRQLLNTTGLLYYTVETATDKGTKLMIQAK